MARTHDGITSPLRPRPLPLVAGLASVAGAAWAFSTASYTTGAALLLVGFLLLINQRGTRRIRVIHSKLLVEDEWLLSMLLVGPSRRRIGWEEVRSVQVDGNRLRLETNGAPFVTAEGAAPEDLKLLAELSERALARARADAAAEGR